MAGTHSVTNGPPGPFGSGSGPDRRHVHHLFSQRHKAGRQAQRYSKRALHSGIHPRPVNTTLSADPHGFGSLSLRHFHQPTRRFLHAILRVGLHIRECSSLPGWPRHCHGIHTSFGPQPECQQFLIG